MMSLLNIKIGLILSIFIIKIFLAFLTFGNGDTNNFAFFYSLQNNFYDVYSIQSPYPYFPFANFINILTGRIADFFNLNFNYTLKLISIIFDFLIGYNIYKYILSKTKNYEYAIKFFLLYSLNPITIFITCFLGFTDVIVIFLLLYACRLNDFKENNKFYIPVVLAISLSIKPFVIIFFPFFFFNYKNKIKFITLSLSSFLLINSFYFFNSENFTNLIFLFKYIFLKMTYGHQVSDHGLGLIRKITENINFIEPVIKIIKYLGFILITAINIYLPKKIKSNKFILLTFLIIFIFSDHVHIQYFLWIIPFLFITKLSNHKILLITNFSIIILFFTLSIISKGNYGLIIFNELLNINSINLSSNKNIYNLISPLLIFLYFYPLIVLFSKSIKILRTEFLYLNFNFIKIIKNLFTINEKNIYLSKDKKFIFFLLSFIFIFFLNYQSLFNTNKKIYLNNFSTNLIDKNKFNIPESILNIPYGNNYIFETVINNENVENIELLINSNHFYEIKINDQILKKTLGYKFDNDLGGENNLYLNYYSKILIPSKSKQLKKIKLTVLAKSLNPYSPPIINYFINDKNKLIKNKNFDFKWDVKYKKNFINYKKILNKEIITLIPVKNGNSSFLSNSWILNLIQFFILSVFNIYYFYFFRK